MAAELQPGPEGATHTLHAHVEQAGLGEQEFRCKRMLWFTGLQVGAGGRRTCTRGFACLPPSRPALHDCVTCSQAKAEDGSETHYITSSSSYLRFYAAALRSAREKAPSLLPVLVVLNSMPRDYLAWVEAQVGSVYSGALWWAAVMRWMERRALGKPQQTAAAHTLPRPRRPQGALVVRHNVSFAGRMEKNAGSDAWLKENLTKQLMASYARLDVPAIMEKVGGGGALGALGTGGGCCAKAVGTFRPWGECMVQPGPGDVR